MLLKLSVTDDQLPQISSGKTAAEIWQQLKELHETSDKSRAFFLKNQLFSIMMDEHICLYRNISTKLKTFEISSKPLVGPWRKKIW